MGRSMARYLAWGVTLLISVGFTACGSDQRESASGGRAGMQVSGRAGAGGASAGRAGTSGGSGGSAAGASAGRDAGAGRGGEDVEAGRGGEEFEAGRGGRDTEAGRGGTASGGVGGGGSGGGGSGDDGMDTSAGEGGATGGASGSAGDGGSGGNPVDPCTPGACSDSIRGFSGDISGQSSINGGVGVRNWYVIEARETLGDSGGARTNVGVRITLTSPPGADYDLVWNCDSSCGDVATMFSPVHNLTGHRESIYHVEFDVGGRPPNGDGGDQTFAVHVGVIARQVPQDQCIPWTLTITTGPNPGPAFSDRDETFSACFFF
jgi:hypothetical protein